MPMIDSDKLKAGLLPVQQAEVAWRQATSDRRAAAPDDRHAPMKWRTGPTRCFSGPAWSCTTMSKAR
jgi:hypothetical protein